MKKLLVVLLILFAQCTQAQRRLEILFLGDNGHHKPIERVPSIMSALGNKGINITYTYKLEDINTQNLAKFDALMIFANWDNITPNAEKALLDYVASGKGILPIHCASFCFRNSPEYVKMVGGQFWRHRMDTIQAKIIQPNHIIMNGLGKIKTYDETYLHSQLQPDNNVLMVRDIKADQAKDRPESKTEPYTWTRSYGKGRVFYTAYGHDERTWNDDNFQKLLENGILWAVNDDARAAHAALNPKPFEYREAKLPNYEKRAGVQVQQLPLSPEESLKHIQVPADFTLDIFAAEPNVMHPIAMDWDEKGRLYVLITKDYPNERKNTGGSDYILLCEDTNKDGKADKFTRFAEGLSIPTGMVFANGGLIVSQAPDMVFLKDNDGDDKVDEKRTLFTGFGINDTHAGPSNLHYGFDNWIWGCVGYAGFNGKVANGDSLKFGQAFFRFKADGSKLEWMTSTSNNTWGMAFNETGDVFGSTANNSHGWYMAIPNRNYLNPSYNLDNGSRSIDTHKDMKTITPRIRQVDVFGGFTAASGHNFYTARDFPKQYWNKIAFVCEPTGHVVHQNAIVKKGTDYEDSEGFNLLAGADEWVSPVFAQTGPDGAVWIADWYSYIIQHNPKPAGFTMGVGNAYETDLRDYTHGRIYRVGYKQASQNQSLVLNKNQPEGLLSALKNTNMFWRMNAQRLLVERGNKDVVPQLLEMLKDQTLDATGINPTVIHVLRTLEGLGVIEENLSAISACLKHPCAGVRKNAVQILPRNSASVDILLNNNLLNDTEPLVVLNTILALSEMPLTNASETAILAKLESSTDIDDRWLPEAFSVALTSHDRKLLKIQLQNAIKKASNSPKTTEETPMMNHDHHAMTQSAKTSTKKPKVTQSPDLVITSIRTEPSTPAVRDNVFIYIELKNQGKAIPAGTIIPLDIRIEGMNRKVNLVGKPFEDGIKSGETVTISKVSNGAWTNDLKYSSDAAGTYNISVEVDKSNGIKENDETNNSFKHSLVFDAPKSMVNFAIEKAVRSYTSTASIDSVITILKQAQSLDVLGANALIKGVVDGWNPSKKANLSTDNKAFMTKLSSEVSIDSRARLNRLVQAWEGNLPNANAQIIVLKTIPEAMKYSLKEFTVTAGKNVEIRFENPDAMQHNLVIGKPKSLEIIGNAANKMITQKDAAEKGYVPAIPQVLFSSPLVNPNEIYRLRFTAPSQPGNYPFVCTFPGHWSIMNGVMKVIK